MKKDYLKLKIKMTLLVLTIFLVACSVLTYQRADTIRRELMGYAYDAESYVVDLRMNDVEESEELIQQVYEVYSKVPRISDYVGFYSMLKDADGNTLAEDQNFIIVQKVGEKIEKRVILLGDAWISDLESTQIEFCNNSFERLEIQGMCDDTFIYLEKLEWQNYSDDVYTYIPEDTSTISQGNMTFEAWAGTNQYQEGSENEFYPLSSFTFFTYGDWKRNVELNAEAKVICEQIFSDYINKIDTMDYQVEQGIFTCYVGITGYISDEYAMPYVYVFHPIEIAMSELVDIYCLAILFGISVIGIIWFSIGKVCKQQLAYENNRRQLTRGIAHELKTPLAITKAYVENWQYLEEGRREENAKVMIGEIDYMDRLVADLLELSRLEAKAKELHLESVDIYALSQSVLRRMRDIIEERKLSIKMDENLSEETFLVNADLEMMRIVLVNFISNAIKYAEKEIEIQMLVHGKRIKFMITNDGRSIEKDKLARVWDEFYKDDTQANSRVGSSGLGLAITKNILILHGARFGCESRDGKTVFWFEMKRQIEI